MNEQELKFLVGRIEKLEQAVFWGKGKKAFDKKSTPKIARFTGIAGGVKLLLAQNFFNHKRTLSDVREELSKHGYHSSIQAVQNAISRAAKPGGPLITFKEGGKKVYAKRK